MEARAGGRGRAASAGAGIAPLVAISATELIEVMRAFRDALGIHQETINRLNVFPVPDGDTGTNMLLTVEAVVRELGDLPTEGSIPPKMAAVCQAIAQGSLMGARGNSGVILCQVLRGIGHTLADGELAGASELAGGLIAASAAARAAVLRPAEGTILTVMAAAAEAAERAQSQGSDLAEMIVEVRRGAIEALWSTPKLLPVLEAAGVVDAGGAGLVLLFDGLNLIVSQVPLPEQLELPEGVRAVLAGGVTMVAPLDDGASGIVVEIEGGLRYEVMYLLDAPDAAVPGFKEVWAGIGDSIVVVGGDGLWNCHIHTNDIGAAIEAALDVGRPREIRVSDLAEQVFEERWVREAGRSDGESKDAPEHPPMTSVVAVATGEGIQRIFRSLGVQHVVAGGQSMNPSTAEILAVLDQVPGEEVVILPNNTNIYPVARQAAELSAKRCVVVATPGIQEGFAALLEYDPGATSAENGEAMEGAARNVVAGEVTQAVRASETPVGAIAAGDWIGLSRAGIVAISDSLSGATIGLLERLIEPSHEIATLIEGAGSTEANVRIVTEWLAQHHPGVTVERHRGGQPLYPFLVSLE